MTGDKIKLGDIVTIRQPDGWVRRMAARLMPRRFKPRLRAYVIVHTSES